MSTVVDISVLRVNPCAAELFVSIFIHSNLESNDENYEKIDIAKIKLSD